ncbi:MAG: Stk1 family PASTA domain-containing Ser/Thr kinase [Clostridia bacterium]|nr:Stk1 family PASTA domain-containing Ser/Thr kinase [Clostridia bacterium]MBQ5480607.1 Stk1 family PASTA domain-containing Ser/Thr kinase [Clostridia bacterium]MBQ5684586.1 Stk1 family PASTA domain-containing Ser/Thr kinase [Clostridia bacterium]
MDNYVGKRLDGRYEIREIVGVGGMAVVYKAYDNIDDRMVSIKVLKDEFLANEEFRRRFKNESKAIAVLSHPNIVKVYDVSLGDKLQYIVMEYVEGITLKEYIEQQGVIPWKEAVHFTTQILRALQHAHDKGIVHRDIKPQNIMLLENGSIKVTDFGIARFSRGETRTMTEAAIGSVHYISPEQARGETTDDKADIYSVGVVLYEMITGRLPFESDSAVSVAIMQVQNEATPPREINPQIPLGLEQITLHAMEKSTANRYQSAAEMLLDLDELKRNPSIKFDYTYFVDKEPTKFINRESVTGGVYGTGAPNVGGGSSGGASPVIPDRDDGRRGNVKRNIGIGVGIGIVAAVIAVLVFLRLFTDVLGGSDLTVPNFVGKIYAEEIDGNERYEDFEFDITYVSSTTAAEGEIIKQDPVSGTKVRKGQTIKLEVVSKGTTSEIPKIYGKTLIEASEMLQTEGFTNLKAETEFSATATPGTVLRSDPAQGTEADTSETILLIVATDESNEKVSVPDVLGMNYYTDKSSVEQFFTKQGLKVGSVTEKDSIEEKGTIIEQSVRSGMKANKGSAINLTVSSGSGAQKTGHVFLTLPNTGNTQTLRVYVANELQKSTEVLLNGRGFTAEIKGNGTDVPIDIYIGETKVYDAKADFTRSTVPLTEVHTYPYASESTTSANGGFILPW